MSIDIADTQPKEPMPIDEVQDFSIRRDGQNYPEHKSNRLPAGARER